MVPRSAALLALVALSGCTLLVSAHNERAPDAGPADAGLGPPPDPLRFPSATCTAVSPNVAGTVEIGVGWGIFDDAAEEDELPTADFDGTTYGYFSARVKGVDLGSVCLEFRVDVAEPDLPNEVVVFDRYDIDLDPLPTGGGEVLGVAMPFRNPALIEGKRGLLIVRVADEAGVSASSQVHVHVE